MSKSRHLLYDESVVCCMSKILHSQAAPERGPLLFWEGGFPVSRYSLPSRKKNKNIFQKPLDIYIYV
jgi:hypothetical protein